MGMANDVNFAEMAKTEVINEVMTADVKTEVMLGAMADTDNDNENEVK